MEYKREWMDRAAGVSGVSASSRAPAGTGSQS